MIADDHTGPVRMPGAGLAVEAPRPAWCRRRAGRIAAIGLAVLAIGGLGATIVARCARAEDGSRPATSNVAGATRPHAAPVERALAGGAGPAREVSMSPRGERVLAVRDRGVDVWRLDGTHAAWLAVDGDRVTGAAWAPDGGRIVVWGPDGTVRLWNADSGAMLRTVQAGMGLIAGADMIDDAHVRTHTANGVRRTWDLATGAVVVERGQEPPGHVGTDAAISADGRWRAYVDPRGDVRLAPAAI